MWVLLISLGVKMGCIVVLLHGDYRKVFLLTIQTITARLEHCFRVFSAGDLVSRLSVEL